MATKRDIDNRQDILDSRDIIARIEELEGERDSFTEDDVTNPDTLASLWADSNPDDAAELKTLLELQEEASGSADWQHGEALIRDSYFEDYARELADDIGAVSKDQSWPNSFIDWEAAAEALKQDYMRVDFDGVEYWIRA